MSVRVNYHANKSTSDSTNSLFVLSFAFLCASRCGASCATGIPCALNNITVKNKLIFINNLFPAYLVWLCFACLYLWNKSTSKDRTMVMRNCNQRNKLALCINVYSFSFWYVHMHAHNWGYTWANALNNNKLDVILVWRNKIKPNMRKVMFLCHGRCAKSFSSHINICWRTGQFL